MNRADSLTAIEEELLLRHLETVGPRDRLVCELGLQTGLRCTELLSLRVGEVWSGTAPLSQVRIQRRRLKGGKGVHARSVRGRVIPLNARAREAIAGFFACAPACVQHPPEAALFAGGPGGREALTRQQFSRIVRRMCLAAGLSPHKVWSSHSLRRTFAKAIATRRGVEVARACLGHRHLTTTQLYVAASEEEAHAAILELGEQKTFSAQAATPVGTVRISSVA